MAARGRSTGGSRDWLLNGCGFSFCGDEKVLELDSGDGWKTLWMYYGLLNVKYTAVHSLPVNARDARDPGSIPGWGRSPGGGNGNPRQYSCLENSMDRGAWRAIVHGVRHDWATECKDTWKKIFSTERYIKQMLTTATVKRSLPAILHQGLPW